MGQGYQGLRRYRNSRSMANESDKRLGDCFHDGKRILPTVVEWHNALKDSLRACDLTTPKVLKMIEEDILLEEPDSRLDTRQLWHRTKSITDPGSPSTLSSSGYGLGIAGPSNVRSPPLPPTSRHHPNTPTKRANLFSSGAKFNKSSLPFILPDPEVQEPDIMSNYEPNDYAPLESGRANMGTNRAAQHWDRTMSQPDHFIDRPNVPQFSSDNHIPDLHIGETQEGNRLGGQHNQVSGARQTTANRTPPHSKNRRDPSGANYTKHSTLTSYYPDEVEADLYSSNALREEVDEEEQNHGRWPSMPSMVFGANKAQHRQPGGSLSQFGFQTPGHDPDSRPTSGLSSPPVLQGAHAATGKKDNGKASNERPRKSKATSTAKNRAAKRLPVLSVSAAIEWKRATKENGRFFNRLRKREEPELAGKWLLNSRVGKRDHVRLKPFPLSPFRQTKITVIVCIFPSFIFD